MQRLPAMIFVRFLRVSWIYFLAVNDKHVRRRGHTEVGMHADEHTRGSLDLGVCLSSGICPGYTGKLPGSQS